MTKIGLLAGASYGLAQDGVAWLQNKTLQLSSESS